MDKRNRAYLESYLEHMSPNKGFGKTFSNSDSDIQDKRVTQLLVVLHQLDESAGGLRALPEPELREVVSSAVRLCGFLHPSEARDVIATVLDGLEMPDPIPERP